MICPSDGAVERHDLDRHRLFRHKSFVGLAAPNAVGHGAHWYGLARQAKFNALLGKVAQVAMLNRRRLVSTMGAPRADATLNDPEPCAPEYFATNKPLVIHRPMALRQEAGPALPTKGYGLVVHSLDHLAAFDCRCPPAWSYPPLSLAGDAALHTL